MHYWVYCCAVIIITSGLFIMLTSDNYLRKIIGLSIFQSAVLIFYIALAKIKNGIPPIDRCIADSNSCIYTYSNPLPHILMLTAIVVGFATFAVGLALIYRIYKQYNTISENEISLKETEIDRPDRPLSQLSEGRGFEGDRMRRSAAHSRFVSDSSTGSKYKSSAKVELQKRPEC